VKRRTKGRLVGLEIMGFAEADEAEERILLFIVVKYL
jgi:hypothetical protein